ncbi:uncharacterized protein LOC125066972 [Vanessa atalanta]|uniref:uncharacterized protein LOC125066972 n=1 Tax=Vanessa atalanta TaxID=42275 RepID=UPI001FCDFEF8|nr:uncharacterized protein LOC125066972 [Vanessa atalanta]
MLRIIFALSLASFCLCLDQSAVLYNEVFAYHNETYFKAEFAYQVVRKIFNAFNQWFFTITFCEFTYFENRILKYTENYGYGYPVMLLNGCQNLNTTKVKPRLNRHGQTAYLVTSDDLTIDDSEYAIEALTRTGVFKPRSAVIFVINVPVQVDSYFYYSMMNHFQLLWSRSITNSIVVLWSDRLRMYSYNPFYKEIREITDIKDISRYLSRLYNDLYGYKLRLSVFRKIYTSDDTGPIYCNSVLAKTIMKQLNATCIPLPPRDGNTVGDLLENGTATGVTADLLDGYTDLELNSRILKNSYYGYIDTTYPLIQDELCFLVKKSMKQSTFMTTLKLISVDMLMLFIFTVIIFIVITVITRRVETNICIIIDKRSTSETILDLVKCFIRQTVDMKFSGPIFRMLVLLIMIYSLVVDCAIDGIITSAITYPRFKPDINSIPEIFQTNLTIGVHTRHLKLFKRSLSDEYSEELLKKIEVMNDKKIKKIIENREFQYALLLRKSDAEYISRKPSNVADGRPLYHTMLDCPVPCSIVFGLRYGSPYLQRLDYIFNHLNQGGILQYWMKSDEYTLFQTRNKILFADDSKDKKPLNTNNLKEVFIVWSIGILISTFIFLVETLVYHINKIPHL